jgi:hypothetical protein
MMRRICSLSGVRVRSWLSASLGWVVLSTMLAALVVSACGSAATPPPSTATTRPTRKAPTPTWTRAATQTPLPTPTYTAAPTLPPTLTSPPPTETTIPTPTLRYMRMALAGHESTLGSGTDKSTVSVYISGHHIYVNASGFKNEVTLMVKTRSNGVFNAIQKIHIDSGTTQTIGTDLPTDLYDASTIEVCLKSMRSNEQNCYLTQSP